MKRVEHGHYVKVHYTAKLADGHVWDSSQGCLPVEIQVGSGQVIKGFEDALLDMAINEKKSFTLDPEKAYGLRDDTLERSLVLSELDLPPGFQAKVGQMIGLQTSEGGSIPATVKHVDSEQITVDLNHPLAGKTISFDIEVVEINDQPTPSTCGCGCSCG